MKAGTCKFAQLFRTRKALRLSNFVNVMEKQIRCFLLYTLQHRAFFMSQLFIPVNAQSVKTLHRQFCPNIFRHVCHLPGIVHQTVCKIFSKNHSG